MRTIGQLEDCTVKNQGFRIWPAAE